MDEQRRAVDKGFHVVFQPLGEVPASVVLVPGRNRGKPGRASQDRQQTQQRLPHHAAISDEGGVRLARDLLRGGAGGDQPVETGYGAASNHNKNKGENRRSLSRVEINGRRTECRAQQKEAQVGTGQPQVEQQRVDVVARLEQKPDGKHGGAKGITEQHVAPRPRRDALGLPGQSGLDRHQHQDKSHRGGGAHPGRAPVDEPSDSHRNHHQGERRYHGLRVESIRKQPGTNVDEDAHGQRDEEKDQDVKETLRARADDVLGDLADAQPPGAHGNDQRAEVVHRADEQRPQHDPQHTGQPAPDDGNRRAEHRREAGNRGVVVPEQDVLPRRDIVNIVAQIMRRGRTRGVQLENFAS